MPCGPKWQLSWGFLVWTVGLTASAYGQLVPWRTFADQDSASVCEVVNTDDAELVVLLNSGTLVLVTGSDRELVNTQVTPSGDVLIDGAPFGFIDFATDAEDFRTLWWMSFTGRAIHLDQATLVPSESDVFPSEVANVPCNACPFWEDGSICVCTFDRDCDDLDECTIDECDPLRGCAHIPVICEIDERCGTPICHPDEGCLVIDLREDCDDGNECTADDLCIDGECIGVEIVCVDDDPCTEVSCDPNVGCVVEELVCDDDNECTDDFCEESDCVFVAHSERCNDGDRCTSNDRCQSGACRGTPIADCDNGGSGGPVIVLCADSMAMVMLFTFSGLLATGTVRRHSARRARRAYASMPPAGTTSKEK